MNGRENLAGSLFVLANQRGSLPCRSTEPTMTKILPADASPDKAPARALFMSTIAFTVCFAVWTIFSIIGVRIKEELGLSETQFGLLVGTPILTGSLTRIVLGIWSD